MLKDFITLEARRRASEDGCKGDLSVEQSDRYIGAVIEDMKINPEPYMRYGDVEEWLDIYKMAPELIKLAQYVVDESIRRCTVDFDNDPSAMPRLPEMIVKVIDEMSQHMADHGRPKAVEHFISNLNKTNDPIFALLSFLMV